MRSIDPIDDGSSSTSRESSRESQSASMATKRRRQPEKDHSMTRQSHVLPRCVGVLLLGLLSCASGVPLVRSRVPQNNEHHPRRVEYFTNEDEKLGQEPNRVTIEEFELVLEPWPLPTRMTDKELEVVRDTTQSCLNSYIKDAARKENMNLDYLLLSDIEEVLPPSTARIEKACTLKVHQGVASFIGKTAPTPSYLAKLVSDGVKQLPSYLSYTQFTNVNTALYRRETSSPTAAPTPGVPATEDLARGEVPQDGGMPDIQDPQDVQKSASTAADSDAPVDDNTSSNKAAYISAGVVAGSVVMIAVIAVLIKQQRHLKTEPIGGTKKVVSKQVSFQDEYNFDDDMAALGVDNSSLTSLDGTPASSSLGDDASSADWTMATNPDDAGTVMTFVTGVTRLSSSTAGASPIHRTESFERDRQVALRKDMLHTSSEWNSTLTRNSSSSGRRKHDDTVLRPSHFGTGNDFEGQAKEESVETVAPIKFSANEEDDEIFLMPPLDPDTEEGSI